jgi:ABC-type Fe3+ transport system substrate-binding protein
VYVAKGEDFFRRLYVEQSPVISRDDRQMEDWLVRGVYPISFGLAVKNLEELKSMGLPIRNAGTLGGGGWVRGPSVSFFTEAPHPNAAKLFLNWLASPDGLRFHAEAEKLPPTRKDVDHPWVIGDEQVPASGRTYAMNADTFDFTTARKPPIMSRIREIVQP